MKCDRCPMYHSWDNESDKGEACGIFGDGWDSPFQYEDKEGTTVGCYLDRHFIEKADAERDEYYACMAQHFIDEGFLVMNKLKKGDFIKCRDKEDAGNIADALVNSGIDWDFCYEKNGEKGIWIEIKEDE